MRYSTEFMTIENENTKASWDALRSPEFSTENLPTPQEAINDHFERNIVSELQKPQSFLKKYFEYEVYYSNLADFAEQLAESNPEEESISKTVQFLMEPSTFPHLGQLQKQSLVETISKEGFDSAILSSTKTLINQNKSYESLVPYLLSNNNISAYVSILQKEENTREKNFTIAKIISMNPGPWEKVSADQRGKILAIFLSNTEEEQDLEAINLESYLATHSNAIENSLMNDLQDDNRRETLLSNFDSLIELFGGYTIKDQEIFPKISLFLKLYNSYNPEIKRMAQELVEELVKEENPEEALEKMISVFETKSLPLVAKRFLMFKYLYPPSKLQGLRIDSATLSTLRDKGQYNRLYHTLQNDMVKVSLRSGEPELMNFLTTLSNYEYTLENDENLEQMPEEAIDQLLFQIMSFSLHSLNGKRRSGQLDLSLEDYSLMERSEKIHTLQSLFVSPDGESLPTSIQKAYLQPLGIHSIKSALEIHNQVKKDRNDVSKEQNSQHTEMFRGKGYIKLVNAEDFDKILDFGVVSREFIGVSSASDVTPLDTDTLYQPLDLPDVQKSMQTLSAFGNIALLIKESNLFEHVSKDEHSYSKGYGMWQDSYEVCHSETTIADNHYGVRSGFASTDIDGLVVENGLDGKSMESLKYYLARKGLYIPIYNKEGTLLYSPQEYDKFENIFAGTQFNPNEYTKILSPHDLLNTNHQTTLKEIQENNDQRKIDRVKNSVEGQLIAILEDQEISMHRDYDEKIYGALVSDTGSTGRGTNKASGMDFDYVIQLDSEDFQNKKYKLDEAFRGYFSKLHPEKIDGYLKNDVVMIRFFGIEIEGEKIDVDISIGPKGGAFYEPASHEAVMQKFKSIEQQYGVEALRDIKEEIILAKTVLGGAQAYKKLEDGGIGGIGVENWILNNGGSFVEACRTFIESCYDAKGELKSLGQFKNEYKLYTYNTGTNLRFANQNFQKRHDNYLEPLTQDAFEKMVELITKEYPNLV